MSTTELIHELDYILIEFESLLKQIFEDKNSSSSSSKSLDEQKEEYESKIENKIKKLTILQNTKWNYYQHKYNKIQWSFHKQMNNLNETEFYENQLLENELNESFIYVSNYPTSSIRTTTMTSRSSSSDSLYINDDNLDNSFEIISTETSETIGRDSFLNLVSILYEKKLIRFELKSILISFHKFKSNLITSLNDFIYMQEQWKVLCNEIENAINLSNSIEQDNNNNNSKLLALVLNHLDDLKFQHTFSFIVHVQNIKNPENILFSNISSDKQSIEKHFRLLSLHFHPDKLVFGMSSTFYHLIISCKDKLLKKYNLNTDVEDIDSLISKGNEYFNEANKFRKYSFNDDSDFECKRNQEFRNRFAMQAYEQYKQACKLADRSDCAAISKKFNLRKYMLLCFFISDRILEAQLIAVSLIFFIHKYRKQINAKQIDEVKQLLDKINNSNINNNNNNNNSTDIFNSDELVECTDLIELNERISEQLKKGNVLILSNIQNVRLNAPKNDLIKATCKTGDKFLKLAYDIGVVVHLFSAPYALFSNLAGTLMGLYVLIDQRKKIVNKLTFLENINKIIEKALDEYKNANYSAFLEQLSQPYDNDKQSALFKLDSNRIEINPKHIVTTLLEYNFPPDGIAYLLNLVANSIVSGIKFKQLPYYRLSSIASDLLDEISCVELENKAIKLDNDISSLRKLIGKARINFSLIKNYLFSSKPIVADELVDESISKGSFIRRLGEIKLVAKINTAILQIINAGLSGIESAKEYIEQLKFLINEQSTIQFNEETKLRLELLELLFWSFTGEHVDTFENNFNKYLPVSYDYYNDDDLVGNTYKNQYLNYLDDLIEKTANRKEKIELLIKKGNKLVEIGQSNDSFKEAITYYKSALKFYQNAFDLDNTRENIAGILALKCLINLKQYEKAIHFSKLLLDSEHENDYQLWLYRGIAYRNLNDFKLALHCFDESIKKQPNEHAKKELLFVESLKIENKQQSLYREEVFNLNKNEHLNNDKNYKILSIDGHGGGVAGILPVMLLAELERRTKIPINKMFNLISGTCLASAPLVAGLSLPLNDLNPLQASNLFDFYSEDLKSIFQHKNYSFFTNYKYNRPENVFDKIRLGSNFLLSNTLTDILIPAVEEDLTVKLFSSYKAKRNKNDDFKILDVIYASSAVLPYFEPFKLSNKIFFNSNLKTSPALLAYNEVTSNNFTNIACLSLGTGCFINDSVDVNKQLLNEYENDNYLKERMGSDYKRWQIYLPEEIKFDDYHKINDLISYGRQFINDNNDLIENFIKTQRLY